MINVIVIGIGYLGLIFYDTVKTHTTEISLTNITEDEKAKIIELNFLELDITEGKNMMKYI